MQIESVGIHSELFGTVHGREVTKYVLTNKSGMRVEILSLGATICAIYVPDRHGALENVVLSLPKLDDYLEDTAFIGRTIGPVANRIANAHFAIDNQEYSLERNDGNHCLHSGTTGLHNKIWLAEHDVSSTGVVLNLYVEHAHMEGGFPGNKQFRASFCLQHDNTLLLSFHASSDRMTPVSLTNHAYFNLAGSGNILNHDLFINSDSITPVDETFIPTKEILEVSGTAFDFTALKLIGMDIGSQHPQIRSSCGFNHNFILNKQHDNSAVLSHANSGRQMTVKTDMPGIQLYTSNFLHQAKNVAGMGLFSQYEGVCLEAQNYPDTPNWPYSAERWVSPISPYKAYISYHFDVIE
ncbi:aldose epimerase family protein [Shewanella acanthi]|uniref:aldose epimerase family protein n=1 Tax=Shewanella acanthi TaxID=2864212 RepID=UPI001C657EE2|nr:aldose epimerase family protein [Shewanella acanthi]QYJ78346.1 galactose mutarotase [Shewanella acanthi]